MGAIYSELARGGGAASCHSMGPVLSLEASDVSMLIEY